jgi:hypothetical protein
MAENSRGLYVWPELSVALRALNDPRFAGAKEWITDRYDNLRIPDAITYRQTGKKSDTPAIIFNDAPRTNILATSSSDWFISNLAQEDTTGGFIPRWLPMQVGKTDRLIPKPVSPNAALLEVLGKNLHEIKELKGDADLSAIEDFYDHWYREAHRKFDAQPNSALAVPFFNRLRVELLKLALIFEVSQSRTLTVGGEAFHRAVAASSDAEKTIFQLIPSGMNREGSEVEKIAEKIRNAGPSGITQSELTRAFQYWKPRERTERLQTLLDSGRVHADSQQTKGRPTTRYVDQAYISENPSERSQQ